MTRVLEKVCTPIDVTIDGFDGTVWGSFAVRRRGSGETGETVHEYDLLLDAVRPYMGLFNEDMVAQYAAEWYKLFHDYFLFCWNEGYGQTARLDGKAAKVFARTYFETGL